MRATAGAQKSVICYGMVDITAGRVDDGYYTYPLWQKNYLTPTSYHQTSYAYNYTFGLPTQVTDPNEVTTRADYDVYGRLWKVARPGDDLNDRTLEIAYYDSALPFWTQATQKLDGIQTLKVRKFYNGLGELIQTQQVGVKVDDVACSAETCTVVTNQKSEYVGGVRTTTQAVPYAVATPDLAGYIALPASPWQNASVTTYDILGRQLVIKAPGQTETNNQRFSYTIDGSRLKTTATDANGHTTESWKDAWGRTVKVQPQIGPWLEYGYDVANRLTTVKQFPQGGSAAFATTTIEYDVAGRKLNMTDPDMGKWYYTYDALSNLTRQADAKGQRICLYYDGLNRLTSKHYRTDDTCPTSNPTLPVSYSYDANPWGKGHRTGMSDASGSTSWSYDARGRVTSETKTVKDGATVLGSYTTSWTYTNADQVKKMTYPGGEEVTSNYLPQGTLTSLTSSYNLTYLSSAAVDAAGRPTVFNLGNGTQTVYTYNTWNAADGQAGKLQKLQSGGPDSLTAGTPNLQSFQYTYDWAGNITKITQRLAGSSSDEILNYDYDEINRLKVEANSANPLYDANTGNLISKGGKALGYGPQSSGCPDGVLSKVHAATSLGTANAYCCDANGNMTRRKIGDNITYTLAYDEENRLKQISGGGGPTYDYIYDGDGQRVLVKQSTGDKTIYIGGYFEVFIKTIYTAPATPPARNCGGMRCIFVPSVITLATSPAPARQIWKSYYSTGAGRVLRVKDNTNTGGVSGIFYLYADHLGSTTVTARMDAIGGDLLSTLSYTAWGETRASSGATPTSLRYTGQREAEAGLYFYQARWYDPYLNRWTQPDSIVPDPGNPLSYDRYAYVYNNPINNTDPSGHWPEWAWVGEFFTGLATEFTRVNNWAGAIVSPGVAQSLAPSGSESDAMIAGRIIGDVLSIAVGMVEVSGGLGIAGGGAVVGCGTILCLASVPAIVGGVAVMSYGVETSLSGAAALGDNLGRVYSRRTEHGDQRASQGNRPTGQAWNDAQKAGPGKVYYDTETGNYIVDGDGGRAHVFKIEDGQLKHHTSFRNPARNTLDRLMSGKWDTLSENQYNDWQNSLNGTLNGD